MQTLEQFVAKWLLEEKDDEFPQVIYIDIKRTWRGQYRWVAKNSRNNRKIATSGESYVNREDAIKAAWRLTGIYSTVYLREPEHGEELLRRAVTNPYWNAS